ncbi:MAG: RNA polymerase sigma factor [Phycisphaerales bacterium]|nr:MAG: RNA polymerase sigma factor [Phycisphaerales bacterium]
MNDDHDTIQILAEAQSGSQAGMGRLATLVWDRLYPFVLRITLNQDATEDILQETLLAMIRRVESLRDRSRFWPWMYRIAWNKTQDTFRRRRLQSSAENSLLRALEQARGAQPEGGNLLDAKIRAEMLQRVAAEVKQLHPAHRDIVELRCYEQLPYSEIASRTQTTPQKARVQFHRAKQSLKTHLACSV